MMLKQIKELCKSIPECEQKYVNKFLEEKNYEELSLLLDSIIYRMQVGKLKKTYDLNSLADLLILSNKLNKYINLMYGTL